jgi:hypothetical protein
MSADYTWPSIYFAYLFFTISLGAGLYFFVRSWKDGYWGKDSEDIKYTVFEDAPQSSDSAGQAGRPAPRKD